MQAGNESLPMAQTLGKQPHAQVVIADRLGCPYCRCRVVCVQAVTPECIHRKLSRNLQQTADMVVMNCLLYTSLGQRVGRVCQHGELNLLDTVGCVMPCLMYKVRIARNGVYFTVNLLELGIQICQILQLGRADKGEISRVEERCV